MRAVPDALTIILANNQLPWLIVPVVLAVPTPLLATGRIRVVTGIARESGLVCSMVVVYFTTVDELMLLTLTGAGLMIVVCLMKPASEKDELEDT